MNFGSRGQSAQSSRDDFQEPTGAENFLSTLLGSLQIPMPANMGDYVFTQEGLDEILTRCTLLLLS